MFAVLTLAAIFLQAQSTSPQLSEPDHASLRCIQDFKVPQYPPLARSASIRGAAIVKISIAEGYVWNIDAAGFHPMLLQAVTQSIENSRFSTACNETIELRLAFRIEGPAVYGSDSGRVIFSPPNSFTITVNPAAVIAD